jgi:hypothetical protein
VKPNARPSSAPGDERCRDDLLGVLNAPWLRPDGPPIVAAPVPPDARPPARRVLVGWGPEGPEARMRLEGAGGPTELQLRQHGPGALTATILTGGDPARETLFVALEQVARRLALRGIELKLERRTTREPGAPTRNPGKRNEERRG